MIRLDHRVPRYSQPALPLTPPPRDHSYSYCGCMDRPVVLTARRPRSAIERMAAYDPTHTTTLRNQFVSGMNRRWRRVRGLIRAAIVDQDCFGLAASDLPAPPDRYVQTLSHRGLPPRRAFAFERSADKVVSFNIWVNRMIEANIFEEASLPGRGLSHAPANAEDWWGNRYIQSAYQKGIANTRRDLLSAGYDLGPAPLGQQALAAAFNQPFHVDRAGLLYTRTFEQLKGITSEMSLQLSNVLSQGIMDGRNPRDLARLLNKTISGIGGTLELTDTLGRFIPAERRAQMLARTEIIRAHHLANVQEMRSWGIEGVSVQAEFRTATDDRVCEECAALHGQRFTLDQIEGMIPVHPNCRCKAYPITKAQVERERAEGIYIPSATEGAAGAAITRTVAPPATPAPSEPTGPQPDPVANRFKNADHRASYERYRQEYDEYFANFSAEEKAELERMENTLLFMEVEAE